MCRQMADGLLSHAVSVATLPEGGLKREIGLWQGTALNIIDMVGIGPFVTLPLILACLLYTSPSPRD